MFSLFEGAQKKFTGLLDYVSAPETNTTEQPEQPASADDVKPAEEVSINTAAIAGKVLSYAKIASNVAQQKASKLSNLVSQTAVFDNLTKQQEQFKESLNAQTANDDVPLPWEGLPNEEDVKKRFLELSQNPNVFLEDAPVEISAEYGPLAKKLLQHDENLKAIRFELVPKRLSEEKFWHNYLYRVSLLFKIIHEETSNESAKPTEQPQTSTSQATESEKTDEVASPKNDVVETATSDKNSPSEDEDWEKALLSSAEFDMVKEANDEESWENELDELLESCKVEK